MRALCHLNIIRCTPGSRLRRFVHGKADHLFWLPALKADAVADNPNPAPALCLYIAAPQGAAPLRIGQDRDFDHTGNIALLSAGKGGWRSKREGKDKHPDGLAA